MSNYLRRIAIDIRMWSHPGIGRYIRELVKALLPHENAKSLNFLGYPSDLEELPKLSGSPIYSKSVSSKIYSVKEQFEMAFKSRTFDVLHVPHFNIPVMRKRKFIATLHDLTYVHDAQASRARLGSAYADYLFRTIGDRASAILTVSEYTKMDLLQTYPRIDKSKVFVTYEAPSQVFRPIEQKSINADYRNRHQLLKPFVLFVGSLKNHKNIPTLLGAVASLRQQQKMDIDLVIVGKKDPKNFALLEEIQKNTTFVKYLGQVSDEELSILYNLAEVFVLPSLREGFGLPVLEAMASGTPVVVSNRTSLPEVAGNAGKQFDPNCVDDLSKVLYNVLSDSDLRRQMSQAGLLRAREFSWKKTAEKTLEIYSKVAA